MIDRILIILVALVSCASGLLALQVYTEPTPTQGVCVTYDVNTVGTAVDRLVIVDGTPMCVSGFFVSINPGKEETGTGK